MHPHESWKTRQTVLCRIQFVIERSNQSPPALLGYRALVSGENLGCGLVPSIVSLRDDLADDDLQYVLDDLRQWR